MGSVEPRECEFWEICPDEGMERPSRVSGIILGLILLVFAFSFLVLLVYTFSWRKSVGNKRQDKNFHLRFNAFKRELTGRQKGDKRRKGKRNKFEGIEGVTESDMMSVADDVTRDSEGSFISNPEQVRKIKRKK